MKIIKCGDLEKAKKKNLCPLTFTCPDCECVFVADNTEYKLGTLIDPGPYAICPCCGRKYVDYNSVVNKARESR